MHNKNLLFPNGEEDALLEITNVRITTNFSHMGEADGIDITCSVIFKVQTEEILMHPNWEDGTPNDQLETSFPNGYFVFRGFKKEKIHYRFFADYDTQNESFVLKGVKKKEDPHCYYLNAIKERYEEAATSTFDHQLYEKIVQTYIKKVSYDKKNENT